MLTRFHARPYLLTYQHSNVKTVANCSCTSEDILHNHINIQTTKRLHKPHSLINYLIAEDILRCCLD